MKTCIDCENKCGERARRCSVCNLKRAKKQMKAGIQKQKAELKI